MPSGSHRETGKRERERARAGKHRQERDRERKRVAQRERDRGWNIANHRISILMLRGGAIVNVEGATLGGFEFYIGPTEIVLRLHKDCASRASVDLSNESAKSPSPIPRVIFYALSLRLRRFLYDTLNR